MRIHGLFVATALVFSGVGQAIANNWAPDGLTVTICGVGLLIGVLAAVSDTADAEVSARLDAVDQELDRIERSGR